MSIKIGINPLTWTNDDLPSLGAETPLSTCLSEGKIAGYSGFELGSKFPRTSEVLGPILKQHELQLVSGWFSGQLIQNTVEQEIAAIQAHLNLLKDLGAKVIVYCEVDRCIHGNQDKPLSQRPKMLPTQWAEYGAKLSQLSEYCLSQGMEIAYHHHMGTLVQTEDDIVNLMDNTSDAVGLLLDTGHLTYAGADPIQIAKHYGSRINHVHCKDIRSNVLKDALNRDLSFLDAMLNGVFTVPGDGCVNYLELFKHLNSIDYHGWLVVEAEQDPSVAHSLTYAKLGMNNLLKLCSQADLRVIK